MGIEQSDSSMSEPAEPTTGEDVPLSAGEIEDVTDTPEPTVVEKRGRLSGPLGSTTMNHLPHPSGRHVEVNPLNDPRFGFRGFS